ncbi:ABC transporter family protein [Histomonas meleagridis]|uniref:ABC transporter family protein n=1 Tax=Histomonas meleagridis TaxID=135588 RepID=UPI00355A3CF7|nr:ABC transporter family protein [Histomonas meleagridis]
MLMGQHYNLLYMYTGISITIADETLSSIRTVRGFNHEESECKRFMDATKMAVKEDQKSGFFLFCLNTLIDLSVWIVVIGNMYYGAQLVDKGEIISSDLISLFGFIFFGFMGIIMFQMLFQEEDRALISGMLLFAILDQEPSIPFDGGDIIENFKGHIEFKDVSFKYPSRDVHVLKNVSFEIKPGEMGALVGHSGSGKSTCIQLLERFYDATDGKILLDGKDIKTLDPHWLHQKISLVSQEPILFQLSVEDNIKYGKRDATKEMVIKAAKKSNALNFIEKLEGKFNYFVGEKGDSVSGGQRQRIAIARALIRDPVILLTDEATSALDAESEKKVQLALNKVMKNRTSVVVAHRLSTIQNANIIYLFDSGEIREKGTHSSLIKKKGYYYELVKMQMKEEHRKMNK